MVVYKGDTPMPTPVFLGEFEQFVLLTIINLGDTAYALDVRDEMCSIAGRRVARGALYRTLDRLEKKRYVRWCLEAGDERRGGQPRRRFEVTPEGVAVLRASRDAMAALWAGAEDALR
jgi:PadR family transcriptional regulator